ncbi:MAG: ChbG/HpnK family deacetylase [Elusimicrobia bacterium]|nr:ChbG/HpnK family deacetylase [Elusimicrobiota bacterium]
MKLRFMADDYGVGAKTNVATASLASGGILSGVSVLASNDSVYPVANERPKDPIYGAHLYLTEFPPLTPKLASMGRGRGLSKKALAVHIFAGRISREDIISEFTAQIEKLAVNGFDVRFLDSHMNIHWLPVVFPAVMEVAKKRGLFGDIRPFAQLDFSLRGNARTYLSLFRAKSLGFKADSRVLVNCPGYKQDRIDLNPALELWDNFLVAVKSKRYEEIVVPCHPGLSPAEVRIYSSPEFRQLLEKHSLTTK